MPSDQEKILTLLNSLAGAVVTAIRSGSAEERAQLVQTLKAMGAQMPAVSEDTAGARDFIQALISLLEGKPLSAEGLDEPYAGIYANIAAQALETERPASKAGPEDETREFLTQVSATVVLMVRKGTDEDKLGLAGKLREIAAGIPEKQKDAAAFVFALTSLLEGSPVDAGSLPAPYAGFFSKVLETIHNGSR